MTEEAKKYGLVTRSDMDGLVCAILLKQLGLIEDITFVHPKDVQDGKIELNENHITTNLPYQEKVHLAFDHHASEELRIKKPRKNYINIPNAPSTAHVVYEYYGGKKTFPNISPEMMEAVDKSDSARFTLEEVLNPQGWVLLSFLMDPRTGLGRFRTFRVSNYQLMMDLIDYCQDHTIDEILQLPDVVERTKLYKELYPQFIEQIKRCATVHDKLVVLDLRNEDPIYPGNRFVIYALYPQCNISMYVIWGVKKQNTVFAVGKSIFNRTSTIDVGELMLRYGGGGHEAAGTCQVANERAEQVKQELIQAITMSA
ncbi:MAG: exopolyphosphatase [Anaerolineae bacterium]|nr:exopolyphosphatase [Anaerolineae bacterium]